MNTSFQEHLIRRNIYKSAMHSESGLNFSSNNDEYDYVLPCIYEHVDNFGSIFMPCIYYFVFIVGLIGNILVITVYIFFQKLKDLTDIYLVNLAVADTLFVFTLPFWAKTAAHEWIFGTIMCKVVRSLYAINLYSCMLTLTCITLDRFSAIVLATKCHGQHTKKMVFGKVLCVCIWLSALVLGTPELIFSKVANHTKSTCEMEFYNNQIVAKTAKGIQLLIGFIIPLLSMIVCYSVIVKTLISAKGFQKYKSIKIILAIVISFVVLQLPYNITSIIQSLRTDDDLYYELCDTKLARKYAIIITEAVAYIHCCLNPILYAFLGQKFKKTFRKILKHYGMISHKQLPEQNKTETETSKTFSAIYTADVTSMYQL
ncbi:C-X-C chemokine receptor type 6 [Protopterus annectens]|uniref:C-X-C chemokine receptor type 6 n=1 Tax=Protopterus annectens TaxID=7888 RepID=UPI001CFA1E54|nr:C-X-C chemokine receptor type 6 [Protopterus annectens]